MNRNVKKYLIVLVDFFEITVVCSLVALIVHFYVGQLLQVSGDSMLPTVKDGEDIIAEKVSIKYGDIYRGDIVIFGHPQSPQKLIIKRVIGLPNEKFLIKDGRVFINGMPINEPYIKDTNKTEGNIILRDGYEYLIPEDNYIVLGDNRDKSTDSRTWGFLPKKDLIAKPIGVFYPLKSIRFIVDGE